MNTNVIFLLLIFFKFKFLNSALRYDQIGFKLSNKNTYNEDVKKGHSVNCERGKKLRVLVHGWLGKGDRTNSSHSYWYPGVKKPYILLDSNVVTVDWGKYSKMEYIFTSFSIVPIIAQKVANFVENFTKSCDIPQNKVHLIGHSLGAHIAGLAGKNTYNNTNKKIGRITGLDPAGPVFKHLNDTNRLSKQDATHVDTIITDAPFQGMNHSCGHVNFYVNGGISPFLTFAHYFAPMVFQQSILIRKYKGMECGIGWKYQPVRCSKNFTNYIGERVDFRKPGDFYVKIEDSEVLISFFKNLFTDKWV